MKKFLLFCAAAAAVASTAMAQDPEPVNLQEGVTYFFRNVKTGYWFANGAGYDTSVTLREQAVGFDVVPAGEAGTYKFHSSFGYIKNGELYVDGDEAGAGIIYLETVPGTNYITIDMDNEGKYLKPGEERSYDPTVEINGQNNHWDSTLGTVKCYHYFTGATTSEYSATDEEILWEIFTLDQRLAALDAATDENPVEATFLLKAATLERQDKNNELAWQVERNWVMTDEADKTKNHLEFGYWSWWNNGDHDWAKHDTFAKVQVDNGDNATITEDGNIVIYQEATGAPAGTYEVKYRVLNQSTSPLELTFNGTKGEFNETPDESWWSLAAGILHNPDSYRTAHFDVADDGVINVKMNKTVAKDVQNRFYFKDFLLKYLGKNSKYAGVEEIAANDAEADAPAEYFNLQGIRVAQPTTGLYIVRQGNKVTKQLIRK